MHVNSVDLECIAFLYTRAHGRSELPIGTAFFVELPDGFRYLITARHILEQEQGEIHIRLNTKSGASEYQVTPHEQWHRSYDSDVAALTFVRKPDPKVHLAYKVVPFAHFVNTDYHYTGPALTEELRRKGGIPVQLGNDVYSFSLFTQRPGEQRNLPVVRFGRISGLPGEPIQVKGNPPFEVIGYVTEGLSWGGHSGSPVFWSSGPEVASKRLPDGSEAIAIGRVRGLLGLVSGHFDIPVKPEPTRMIEVERSRVDNFDTMQVRLNAALVVVTPSDCIRKLLMREDLVREREALK